MTEFQPSEKDPRSTETDSGTSGNRSVPITSGALRINLQRTALPVHIPDDQRLLLDVVKDKVGIYKQTESLLRETNHPYANWDELVEQIRSRALGDFYYYNKHAKGPQAFSLFSDLFFQCLDKCRPGTLKKRALFSLLDFLELILLESGKETARNRTITEQVFSRLEIRLRKEPGLAARGTAKLKKMIKRVLSSQTVLPLEKLAHLYLFALKENYQLWLSQDSLDEWYRAQRNTLFGGGDYEALFDSLSHRHVEEYLKNLQRISAADNPQPENVLSQTLPLPDFSSLEQTCLCIAHEMEDPKNPRSFIHKIHYLIRLLELPALADQYETILRELGRCLEQIRYRESSEWEDLLGRLFHLLKEKADRYENAVLDCVYTIGREVVRIGNPKLLESFVDEIISLGFQYPDRKGVNRDWQVQVNPYHLKNIRHWLSFIQMNPSRSQKLISALIINLKLGGLFVSDTDLCQKDISQLLASDIRSSYALIKALTRLFPVYFQEIGAEGELRDVSTAVDELCGRHDILIHFLRKQCHVESNNQIITFMERIVEYWQKGRKESVKDFLPLEIYEQIEEPNPFQEEMALLFQHILDHGRLALENLIPQSSREIFGAVQGVRQVPENARRKAELFIQLYRLLIKKYTINHYDILKDLRESNFFPANLLNRLDEALQKSDHERSLEILLLGLLPILQENIFSKEESLPHEEIYRKRHIAVGIPSMYGRYKEKRFDSLGLTFRLESLAEVLFGELTSTLNLEYITQSSLERVHKILKLYVEALQGEGIVIEALASNLTLLKHALARRDFTIDQYLNIFQFMANTVKDIIQTQYIGIHETNLNTIITGLLQKKRPLPFTPAEGASREEIFYQASEWFIRDHLSKSFVIQSLDLFIGRVLGSLAKESQSLDRHTRTLLLSYDPEKCFTPFQSLTPVLDTQVYLGNKGYFLKRLTSFGYPVPPGFIVTTEFFRCREAIRAYRAAEEDLLQRLRREIQRLEKTRGGLFGDPKNPLLLSVRSGSTISMPGMMNTFLNIGINDEITENLAKQPRFEWAAWDNYRRFLQCWGMSFGVPRDRFDELINEVKRIYSAKYKRELLPEQMRDLAFSYKRLLEKTGVNVPSDPWEQLQTAIYQVLASWNSELATLYRQAMKIAEEWGTAVILQQMVFGNLDANSGTGVLFTRNPKKITSTTNLFGDYTVCAQGEDVVSGLVETYPISEHQRQSENIKTPISLEREFPKIYHHLKKLAEDLLIKRGFRHQEIEFTFESHKPSALYILQVRDIVPPEDKKLPVFVPTSRQRAMQLATGIGVGGGALCGMAVHRQEEIDRFRRQHPDTPLILLRPDTVPEDIDMILKVDGILTARGGSTSHAAVTAFRLGKTCVVGCRQLRVNEKLGRSMIDFHVINSGDWLSVDGQNGFIYKGRHETVLTFSGIRQS